MIVKYLDTNKKEKGPMKITEYKINSNFSGALIEIDGRHRKVKCLNEDRVYFIIKGNGKFIIDDKEEIVSKNDLVFIPQNTPYDIIGKLKFFLICSPEFNPKDDISLE
jgi:mannose-6-phosphate isomerase-like protein (cupin superfamily)